MSPSPKSKTSKKSTKASLAPSARQTKVPALSSREIQQGLNNCPNWKLIGKRIKRDIVFKNFSEAFAAMTRIAIEAERLDHHPEWSNVYNRLSIELITHDAGPALSEKDFTLAQRINEIVKS